MFLTIEKFINKKEVLSVYNNWELSEKEPLSLQVENLDEDLIQMTFKGAYLLDIGWYPEHNLDGCFRCVLIRNQNWDCPVYEFELKTIPEVVDWFSEMIECVLDFDLKSN